MNTGLAPSVIVLYLLETVINCNNSKFTIKWPFHTRIYRSVFVIVCTCNIQRIRVYLTNECNHLNVRLFTLDRAVCTFGAVASQSTWTCVCVCVLHHIAQHWNFEYYRKRASAYPLTAAVQQSGSCRVCLCFRVCESFCIFCVQPNDEHNKLCK